MLQSCTEQTLTAAMEEMELTAAQGHLMGYLIHSREPRCPRDVEKVFHLSHPTVSGLLSRLEQKGFVELRTDPEDRRFKRIYLLPKAWQLDERISRTLAENERKMTDGFTQQEREAFAALLQRAIHSMGGEVCCHHGKEEESK